LVVGTICNPICTCKIFGAINPKNENEKKNNNTSPTQCALETIFVAYPSEDLDRI
jgi:hypothetical protein